MIGVLKFIGLTAVVWIPVAVAIATIFGWL